MNEAQQTTFGRLGFLTQKLAVVSMSKISTIDRVDQTSSNSSILQRLPGCLSSLPLKIFGPQSAQDSVAFDSFFFVYLNTYLNCTATIEKLIADKRIVLKMASERFRSQVKAVTEVNRGSVR